MKKVKLIASITALTMIIASCQKDKLNQQVSIQDPHQNASGSLLERKFNYKETITVLDKSGQYSADFIIQSNDKQVFDEEINRVSQLIMVLSDQIPASLPTTNFAKNQIVSPKNSSILTKEEDMDYDHLLFRQIKNIKRGNAKGFSFETKNKTKTTETNKDVFVTKYENVEYIEECHACVVTFLSGVGSVTIRSEVFFNYPNSGAYIGSYTGGVIYYPPSQDEVVLSGLSGWPTWVYYKNTNYYSNSTGWIHLYYY